MSERKETTTLPETSTSTALADSWNVLVFNDPVNLMSYVVLVFRKVFGYTKEKAHKHMLEVHHKGRSVLWSGDRETAEHYVQQLHIWQINAKLDAAHE